MNTLSIAEFCTTSSGGTPSREKPEYYENGSIPWIKSGELKKRIINNSEEFITNEGLNNSSAKIIPKGAILLAMYGATVGEVAELGVDAATNQAICNIRPNTDICHTDYLFHFLKTIKPKLISQSVGGGQPNISQAIIRAIEVPLPELSEQRRTAAILDKAEALRSKRREAIAKLDQLLQSVFLEMFGDPVTNPKNWPAEKALGEMADIISGITKGRKTTSETRTVPYLAVANVQDRYLKLNAVKEIDASEEEIARYQLKKNDLLLTEGGDPDKLGRGSLWSEEIEECIHQNHVFRVRLTSNKIHPIYLNWLVGSQRGKRYFLSVAKQTTGIASINLGQLKRFPLLIPPIALQEKFALIESKIRESQIQTHQASLKQLDALQASLQQKYFQ